MKPKSRSSRRNRTVHRFRRRQLGCERLEERTLLAVVLNESNGGTAVAEGGASDTYTVALNTQPTANVTIAINAGSQLTASPNSLTFTPANWSQAQQVQVDAVDDTAVEGNHTGTIAHTASSADTAYNDITINNVTVAITDNEPPLVTVTATDNAAAEPSDAGTFRIARAGSTTAELTVNFTASGSATRGATSDYVLKVGSTTVTADSITMPAGQSFVDVTLEIVDDDATEPTEQAVFTLQTGTGYTLGAPNSATVTVTDNEQVGITVIDDLAGEPADHGLYRITRAGSTAADLTINFDAAGSATRGATSDYVLKNGATVLTGNSVTIPAGQTSVDVTLEVVNDLVAEPLETVVLTLTSGNYTVNLQNASAMASIDDDEAPVVSIAATDASAAEPSDTGTYRITRLGSTGALLNVAIAATGTATQGAGNDYRLKVGATDVTTTVAIPGGQSFVDVTLEVIDNTTIEPAETAILTLQSGATYTLGTQTSATVNIADNDTPVVTIAASDNSAAEPSDGGTYRISRAGSTEAAITVNFTANGTATRGAGGDYLLKLGSTELTVNSVTIPVGQTFIDVTLAAVDNTTIESSETAILTLQSGTGYTVGTQASATVNIADNDTPVLTITATDASAAEPSDGGTYRISRAGSTEAAITVNFAVSGTATRGAGNDYLLKNGTAELAGTTISIPAGQSFVDVTLEAIDNTTIESSETAIVTLLAGTGYTVGTPASATVNIADNDAPVVTIAATD
ncbi:MAG: hypothetical protein HUU20_11335, partial [Pirellulales bacterium]|nr:hypothetical protein [Pirellulales bacterium]